MSPLDLHGCGVATITPFLNGKVDFEALKAIVDFQIGGGVDYITCLGTTAETATLTESEQQAVLECVLNTAGGRVPVVAGQFGGNNTAEIIRRFDRFALDGCSAILSVSPYYNKPSQEGIFQHYKAIAAAAPLPIIIYNVPGRTASNVTADTVVRIAAECERVVAVKDASSDLAQATQIVHGARPGFLLLSGDDATTLPLIACGGQGVISVIANAYPKAFSTMVRYALAGDYTAARAIHDPLIIMDHWLYLEGNPTGIKACMAHLGLCTPEVRLPLVPMTETTSQALFKAMAGLHLPE